MMFLPMAGWRGLAAAMAVMAVPVVTGEPVACRLRGPMPTTAVRAVVVAVLFKVGATARPAVLGRRMPGLPVRREPLGVMVERVASVLDRQLMELRAVPAVQTWAKVVRSGLAGTPDQADQVGLQISTSIAAVTAAAEAEASPATQASLALTVRLALMAAISLYPADLRAVLAVAEVAVVKAAEVAERVE